MRTGSVSPIPEALYVSYAFCIVNFRTTLSDIEALPPLLSRLGTIAYRESVVKTETNADASYFYGVA
jgi:hypothetical protein